MGEEAGDEAHARIRARRAHLDRAERGAERLLGQRDPLLLRRRRRAVQGGHRGGGQPPSARPLARRPLGAAQEEEQSVRHFALSDSSTLRGASAALFKYGMLLARNVSPSTPSRAAALSDEFIVRPPPPVPARAPPPTGTRAKFARPPHERTRGEGAASKHA